MAEQSEPDASGRWVMLGWICLALVGSMATWFSATAVVPELTRIWSMSPGAAAWLTNGVQIGFVVGAIGSSFINLPDIVPMPRLIAVSALVAAGANAFLLVAPSSETAIAARFVTGLALAGVYPPAVKLIATWFRTGRGLALGAAIGALTLGSSMPHLVRALTAGFDWHQVVLAASLASLAAAGLVAVVGREGPYPFSRAVFSPRQIGEVARNRPLMLANLGYFGHMWELYALWGWYLAFATAAMQAQGVGGPGLASLLTFVLVGAGTLGCVLGGVLSDRIGRTATCALMLGGSGLCALVIGFTFGGPLWLMVVVSVIWGVTVVGDSAQFSTMITELSDGRYVGTALTFQMGVGFALTVLTIWLTPIVAEWLGGWQWSFVFLVPGPIVGIWAMWALRRSPEATRLAHGRR
ncbi:MAG: MFS transporter [Pseudomonadota bacterium]